MNTRAPLLALFLALAFGFAVACASVNGYDASRYAPATAGSVDPEIEPLPPSQKRRMRDPRGVPMTDAGAGTGTVMSAAPPVDASRDADDAIEAPSTASSAAAPACGKKGDGCPMQRFMHGAMETAHTPDTLTAAFTRLAGMSPDPAWAWVAIATRGADLANAGDVAAAKAQCKACHDAYREKYRSEHRARPL